MVSVLLQMLVLVCWPDISPFGLNIGLFPPNGRTGKTYFAFTARATTTDPRVIVAFPRITITTAATICSAADFARGPPKTIRLVRHIVPATHSSTFNTIFNIWSIRLVMTTHLQLTISLYYKKQSLIIASTFLSLFSDIYALSIIY